MTLCQTSDSLGSRGFCWLFRFYSSMTCLSVWRKASYWGLGSTVTQAILISLKIVPYQAWWSHGSGSLNLVSGEGPGISFMEGVKFHWLYRIDLDGKMKRKSISNREGSKHKGPEHKEPRLELIGCPSPTLYSLAMSLKFLYLPCPDSLFY